MHSKTSSRKYCWMKKTLFCCHHSWKISGSEALPLELHFLWGLYNLQLLLKGRILRWSSEIPGPWDTHNFSNLFNNIVLEIKVKRFFRGNYGSKSVNFPVEDYLGALDLIQEPLKTSSWSQKRMSEMRPTYPRRKQPFWGPRNKELSIEPESGPWPTAGRKIGTLVLQLQGNEVCQQLVHLEEDSEPRRATAWLTP